MRKLVLGGLAIGAIAASLVAAGNPGNMGVCVACFLRDIAGSFGGAPLGMAGVAYVRPELIGLVLGALASAVVAGEFRARGGSAFWTRYLLGFVFMAAALVFLGCTVRAWLRLAGGDLNALVGVGGLVVGIAAGSAFLKRGYSLGQARELPRRAGLVVPAVFALLLGLALATAAGRKPAFLTVTPGPVQVAAAAAATTVTAGTTRSAVPPGGRRAPLIVSLLAGVVVGVVAQRSRLCTTGGIRDLLLWRRTDKLLGIAALVVGAWVVNVALGQFRLGFVGQPVAHTDTVANFASMAVAGVAAVLMGGCPLRQLVMAGEGDVDAGGALLGMFTAALVMHGTGLASSPRGAASGALAALALLATIALGLGWWRRARPTESAPSGARSAPPA